MAICWRFYNSPPAAAPVRPADRTGRARLSWGLKTPPSPSAAAEEALLRLDIVVG
jgi:hypothetical protein